MLSASLSTMTPPDVKGQGTEAISYPSYQTSQNSTPSKSFINQVDLDQNVTYYKCFPQL